MEFLRRQRSQSSRAARTFFGLMVVSLAGCAILEIFEKPKELPLAFSHLVHFEDEGMDCIDCHSKVETSDEPGIPRQRQCMLCHEDLDEEKPPEKQVASLFVDGEYVATRASALSDEVRFSHMQHANSDQECSACHARIFNTKAVSPHALLECTVCHTTPEEHRVRPRSVSPSRWSVVITPP